MPNLFIVHKCYYCGYSGEVNLSRSGKHIKASCGSCNKYIKFIDRFLIPTVKRIREKIWEVSNGDVSIIEEAKKLSTLYLYNNYRDQILWWDIYTKIIKILNEEA